MRKCELKKLIKNEISNCMVDYNPNIVFRINVNAVVHFILLNFFYSREFILPEGVLVVQL